MVAHIRAGIAAAALALMIAASGATLRAQHYAPSTTAQAAASAGAIVVARVADVTVKSEGWIYTQVAFETTEVLKGSAPPRFTSRMMGGRVGTTQTATGMPLPRFTSGEEVVVFLAAQAAPDGSPILLQDHVYRVAAGAAGERTVVPAPTGFAAPLRPTAVAGPAGEAARAGARYADFRAALKSLK